MNGKSFAEFFDKFYVVTGRFTDWVGSSNLYAKYAKWCGEEDKPAQSRKAVKQYLTSFGGITWQNNGRVYYTGLRERKEDEMGKPKLTIYSGQVYIDAGKIATAAGKTVDELCEKTNNTLIANIANAKDRKGDFIDYMTANCVESDFDGYMALGGELSAFCNLFFLKPDDYLVDVKELVKNGKKIEPPKTAPTAPAPTSSQIGDLLDMILEEQKRTNDTLTAILTSFSSIVGTIADKDGEMLNILQRMGPKLGEMDKKLKNIDTSTTTVSKSWGGLVASVGDVKSRFERYTSR
jgi:hypothetical protein